MSWLPQRWRTQRNAIRHANCTIQWVIKTLNATCTSFGEYVCSSVCSSPPKKHSQVFFRSRPFDPTRLGLNASRWNECLTRSNFWKWWLLVSLLFSNLQIYVITVKNFECVCWREINQKVLIQNPDRTSNQSRIPAEFKHITKRRKRN